MMADRMVGVSDRQESGERLERARRNRKTVIFAGLMVSGGFVGFMIGMLDGDALLRGSSAGWPPAVAIAIAISYLASVIGGGVALSRQIDEVERLGQYKAVAAAALCYALVYPVWFVLWMGNLVREPMHGVLFGLFWLALFLASLFYRFR